jgi:hypothetical protein
VWDLALDGATGDFIFGPNHDLLGSSGNELTEQRILVRTKIPRGSFTYDADGTLGSQLHAIMSYPSARQLNEAPAIVQQALNEMDDIQITSVDVEEDAKRRLIISVSYSPVPANDSETDLFEDEDIPEFTTDLTLD